MFKLFLFFVAATFVGPALCNNLSGRILKEDGKADDPLKYRYHVAILVRETENSEPKYRCGGAIIDSRFVLTAAHCVYGIASKRIVLRGGTKEEPPKDKPYLDQRIFRGVAKVMYKRVYLPELKNYQDDIAVLKVLGAFDIGKKYGASKLSLPVSADYENVEAVVMGYGAHNESKSVNKDGEDFRSLKVEILPDEKCDRDDMTTYRMNPNVVCTQPIGREGHTCKGDGGNPLVYNGQIVGVLTEPKYCDPEKPELYTRVSAYLDFINDRLKGVLSRDVVYL